eukprot:6881071-Ditylum_brightwellii.AAC.1
MAQRKRQLKCSHLHQQHRKCPPKAEIAPVYLRTHQKVPKNQTQFVSTPSIPRTCTSMLSKLPRADHCHAYLITKISNTKMNKIGSDNSLLRLDQSLVLCPNITVFHDI